MTDRTDGASFPRRDRHGRIDGLIDLLAMTLAGLLVGLIALVLFDVAFALVGLGGFGHANGWLAAVLPAWLFLEEFRAWRGVRARIAVALVAAPLGLLLGTLAAGATSYLPPLGSGAIGAAVAVGTYALIWYFGIRRVAGTRGGEQ